jgi:hypothetical protein
MGESAKYGERKAANLGEGIELRKVSFLGDDSKHLMPIP